MAATAVYFNVVRVPLGGTTDENYVSKNGVPALDTVFNLNGGLYALTCKASTYGTVALQVLCQDGSTWVATATAFAADGYSTVNLPAGQYRIHAA